MTRTRILVSSQAGQEPCYLQVAALPWRRTVHGLEVMLITSRGTGRWVLPKGWPESGEALPEAAAREAIEEAGLVGAVSDGEAGRYHYTKITRSGRPRPCEVSVFPLEVRDAKSSWREKGERRRRWMSPARAASMVDEPELSDLIATFCAARQSS